MASLIPNGISVDIVGINASDRGRSCDVHATCGTQLVAGKQGTVLRIREVTISRNAKDETALALYVHSLEDGIDGCRVGFLRQHLLKHKELYVNKCVQVSKIYSEHSDCPSDRQKHYRNHGCCRAVVLHEVALEQDVSPLKMDHSPSQESPGYLNYLIKLGEEDTTPEHNLKKRNVPVTKSVEAKKKAKTHVDSILVSSRKNKLQNCQAPLLL